MMEKLKLSTKKEVVVIWNDITTTHQYLILKFPQYWSDECQILYCRLERWPDFTDNRRSRVELEFRTSNSIQVEDLCQQEGESLDDFIDLVREYMIPSEHVDPVELISNPWV